MSIPVPHFFVNKYFKASYFSAYGHGLNRLSLQNIVRTTAYRNVLSRLSSNLSPLLKVITHQFESIEHEH